MKTKINQMLFKLVLIVIGLAVSIPLCAQDSTNFIVLSGVVKDKQSKKKLAYVSVAVQGTGIGTITNSDGSFSIKIKDPISTNTLEVSHIGYNNQQYAIKGNRSDLSLFLEPNVSTLYEALVQSVDPVDLVRNAINKKVDNNSLETNLLTGFYRETIKKGRDYINISEAVIGIYKTPYTQDVSKDKVQVYKGRKLLSPKVSDTLIVKFQGGPNLSIYLDVVKNPDLILNMETLSDYDFKIDDHVMINERVHYVVSFKPRVVLPYALHYGKLYIDRQNLTLSRAELNLSMDDRNKATQVILRKKPFKLKFKPEEVSFLVTYKQHKGKSYLNYIRSEIRFKCDWQNRFFFFSTNYEIISEMVATDISSLKGVDITNKLAFKKDDALSDKVSDFFDKDFWNDYNIIEPTESLESAVNKLKKRSK